MLQNFQIIDKNVIKKKRGRKLWNIKINYQNVQKRKHDQEFKRLFFHKPK